MKLLTSLAVLCLFTACTQQQTNKTDPATASAVSPIEGTWKLLRGTLIEHGDTAVTDYTGDVEMIKIINKTHFSFLNHNRRDTAAAFSGGGGRYTFSNGDYTEHLDYCTARAWEGHTFQFKVEIANDTLIQSGVEEIASQGIKRLNIEKYVRVQ